jgi:hypothetical protein
MKNCITGNRPKEFVSTQITIFEVRRWMVALSITTLLGQILGFVTL